MKKIFKYQIEDELKKLKDIDVSQFDDYINRITAKENRIVRIQEKDKFVYYCTHCQNWHNDKKVKIKEYKTCPHCHRKLKVISKRNIIADYNDFITVIEKNSRKELILRIFHFSKRYKKEIMKYRTECFEVERINVDRQVYLYCGVYSNMGVIYFRNEANNFKKKSNYYNLENYIFSDNVITTGLSNLIKDTQFKYSCLDKVAKQHIHLVNYLKLYMNEPRIELLVKNKNYNLVSYCSNHNRMIEIEKNEFKYLKHDLTYDEFIVAKEFCLDNYNDIRCFERCKAMYEEKFICEYNLQHKLKRLCKYLYNQKKEMNYYRDYITAAQNIGMDLNDHKILYPKSLGKSHDIAIDQYKIKKDKAINEGIITYAKELNQFYFNNKTLLIRPVMDQLELINESRELHHCVRTYDKSISQRTTSIFVIRSKKDKNKPFVTLELKNEKVIQCRAYMNQKPNDSVIDFVNEWCKKFKFKSCFD